MINPIEYLRKLEKQDYVLTKFLDTQEASELRKLNSPTLHIWWNGGYEDAERTRGLITKTSVDDSSMFDFEIAILKIQPHKSNRIITHRHVLGTILSFGIKREMIGDIVFNNEGIIYVFVDRVMENYIISNLTSINNVLVKVSSINNDELAIVNEHNEKTINVASLRLDGILSHTMNISRTSAEKLIEMGNVQINHIECLSPSKKLNENDLISIRHFGRITILGVVNTTKKDRLVLKVDIKH